MEDSTAKPRRPAVVRVALTALALFLLVAVVVSGLLIAIAKRESAVRREWEQRLGSVEELLGRYPPRQANRSALEVEALSAALGIDIATRGYEDRRRPTDEALAAHKTIKTDLHIYLGRQLERADSKIAAPPDEVLAFVERSEANLDALRRHLLGAEQPRWEYDLEALFAAPIPNLLGHIDLQKLLLTHALLAARRGETRSALDDLEASWRLNAALRDDPVLITQLVAMTNTRFQAGVLRRVEAVPVLWQQRMRDIGFRETLPTAMLLEGWIWSRITANQRFDATATAPELPYAVEGMGDWGDRVRGWWAKGIGPYVRLCLADASDRWRLHVEGLSRFEHLCNRDLAELRSLPAVKAPRWNAFGEIITPNLGAPIERLARLELDTELTARILELRSLRDAEGGWPDPLPANWSTAACPEDRWIVERAEQDAITIRLGSERDWLDGPGTSLPLNHTLQPVPLHGP